MSEPTAKQRPRAAWWTTLQRALGYGPLLVFSVYHLWEQWPALYGRDAWLDRVQRYGLGNTLGAVVIALFAAHAGLGLYRRVRFGGERALPAGDSLLASARARRQFHSVTGITIVLFTMYHLTHVWPRPDGISATLERSHERLWELLGRPVVLTAYVLGCGALAGHAAHALALLLEPRLPPRAWLWLRMFAGLCGVVLFTLYLQLIGQYAAGEPMLPSAGASVIHAAGM